MVSEARRIEKRSIGANPHRRPHTLCYCKKPEKNKGRLL